MPTNKRNAVAGRPARIMIVDDHPIVREGLAALLSGYPEFTVSALVEDVATALKTVDVDPPDVAVVDLSLKNESGLDLIQRINERNKSVRILAVSMHDENLYGQRVLAAGAMGYLSKQAASRRIVEALRLILDGKVYLSEELTDRLVTRHLSGGKSERASGVASLTDRELEVFTLIGNGLTTVEIGEKLHLSTKTIETHRQKIKLRLNLRKAAELSRAAAQWVVSNQ